MNTPEEPGVPNHPVPDHPVSDNQAAGQQARGQLARGQSSGVNHSDRCRGADPSGVLKAMSPGVVDFLFRRLVAGESAEDIQWNREGTTLTAQPVGAELARRLAETDVEALTPTELFHYVRAAQRLAAWAESLKEEAVQRYCGGPDSGEGVPLMHDREARARNSGRLRGKSS